LQKDYCPNGDLSQSYYDGRCELLDGSDEDFHREADEDILEKN
jgi:hypothetical protein